MAFFSPAAPATGSLPGFPIVDVYRLFKMLGRLLRPVERGGLSRINAGGDVAKRRDGTGIDTQGLQRLAENTVWEIEVVHLGASLGRIILWEKAHRASVWAATGFVTRGSQRHLAEPRLR